MGKTADYGGIGYGGRADVTKVTKESCRSFHCMSCGTRRFVTYTELNRRARARCLACGGTLEESDASVARNCGVKKERVAKKLAVQFGKKPRECPVCDKRFRTEVALAMHVEENHATREEPA